MGVMSIAMSSATYSYHAYAESSETLLGRILKVATIVGLHAAVGLAIWGLGDSAVVRDMAQTIEVRLIAAEPVPPLPRVAQPVPRSVVERPAPRPKAEPVLVAAPSAEPAAPVVAAAPVAPPSPAAPAASPKAETPASLPVTEARFDANYLHNPRPAYPPVSRRLGEEGRVLLRVQVTAEGQACKVELKQSSGFSRLDQAALDAVARWRFVPARRGDETIASWVTVPINFTLES